MSKVLSPKFDRVLVKRDSITAPDSKIIVASTRESPPTGVVIAVGPTAGTYRNGERIETIEPGTRVVFALHAGTDMSSYVGEKPGTLWLIVDNDVLCVISDK